MKNTFIYCLVDPVTKEVRYVGKSNDVKQRFKAHINPARIKNTYKFNWINKLKKLNLKPELVVIDEVSIDEWKYWEKYWIEQMINWGFNLTNTLDGGQGLTFGNKTSFKKGYNPWNKGKPRTEETKNKIRNKLKGKKIKPQRKVDQYDMENNFLETFNSITEASVKTDTRIDKITLVCQGKRNSTNNFKWKYNDSSI